MRYITGMHKYEIVETYSENKTLILIQTLIFLF